MKVVVSQKNNAINVYDLSIIDLNLIGWDIGVGRKAISCRNSSERYYLIETQQNYSSDVVLDVGSIDDVRDYINSILNHDVFVFDNSEERENWINEFDSKSNDKFKTSHQIFNNLINKT